MWFHHYVLWFQHYVMWFLYLENKSLLPVSSIITQVFLFLKNLFIQFLWGPSAYSWNLKMAGVSEGEGNANLLSLLEKLYVGHLLENFQREKVTDGMLRCKLSKLNDEFKVKVFNLWMQSTAKENRGQLNKTFTLVFCKCSYCF